MNGRRGGLKTVRHAPLIPNYGHLQGHYPAYTMVTCQRKEIKTINLYFHAFYNQNIKFFTSHNLVSLVTPEGLTKPGTIRPWYKNE